MKKYRIALAGNPNVGKSTVFNALTGLRRHTGNWSGKTVDIAEGDAICNDIKLELIDLPGAYSLTQSGGEEGIARDFLCSKQYNAVIIVCDATVLERNLILVLQILSITKRAVICINMMDEAAKKGIEIDCEKLSEILEVPVCPCCARDSKGIENLVNSAILIADAYDTEEIKPVQEISRHDIERAHYISCAVVKSQASDRKRDRSIDRILTGKYTGVPIMLLLLALILFITIFAANYPSDLLMRMFSYLQHRLEALLNYIHCPAVLISALCDGVFKTVGWVLSVMLPPMAIFFPLFTILEDVGYLPRIAFNLDKYFRHSGACGKQALTTCMGFGCNAVGVTGCRIIDSERERTLAQLTNNFVPCNGRFPTLIAVITMFVVQGTSGILMYGLSALSLTALIVVGIVMTLVISKLLSKTIFKGEASSFILELPPYRVPQFGKILVNSLLNRTVFVMCRALAVAAPAGLLIWLLSNTHLGNLTMLQHISDFLDPFGRLIGMDGVILLAFILGFPANEIVIPTAIMAYTCSGSLTDISNLSVLKNLLIENDWTLLTAICTMLFSIMHWPCSTTCITIYKETRSIKKTLLAIALPTLCGIIICMCIAGVYRLIF